MEALPPEFRPTGGKGSAFADIPSPQLCHEIDDMTLRHLLAAAALLLATAAASAPARAEVLTTRYAISLLGLSVGRADFETRFEEDTYSVSGTLGSAGLANIMSRTAGTSSVSGRIGRDGLEAERYRLSYSTDARSYSSDVRYRSGQALSASVAPPPRTPPAADYVPLDRAQLRDVVDPLSGLMIRAGADPSAVCRRTLPFFDGWSRLDLVLQPAGQRDVRVDGYSGPATVCAGRIVPRSGYREGSSGIRYLREQTLEFWFAPAVADRGIWAPVLVRVPTKLGPLSISATTFARP